MTTGPTSPRSSRGQAHATLAVLFFVAAVCTIDRLVINLMVDPIRADLAIGDTQMSLLQGLAFSLFYSLAGLPLGVLADRRSRRNLMIGGVAVWSAATVASSLATTYPVMFVARIFVGAGEATMWPVAVSLIGDLYSPRHRGRAISSIILGQIFGSSVALFAGGLLIKFAASAGFTGVPLLSGRAPWRIVLTLCAGFGLVMMAALAFVREPARSETRPLPESLGLRPLLVFPFRRDTTVLLIFSTMFFMSLAVYTSTAWTITFYLRHFALSPGRLGPMLGAIGLAAGIAGTFLAGSASDHVERLGRRAAKLTIAMIAMIGCAPAGLIVLSPSLPIAYACTAVASVAFPIAGAVMIILLQDLTPPDMRGFAMSITNLIGGLFGATLGPLLAAFATDHLFHSPALVGWSLMVVILPALALSLMLTVILRTRLRAGGAPAGGASAVTEARLERAGRTASD